MPYRFALFVVAVNELPVTTLVNVDTTSNSRTFLVAQWLRLGFPMQGREGLVQELRSHMPCGQKNRSNIVTNSIKIKKKILIASFHNLEHFSASENKHMTCTGRLLLQHRQVRPLQTELGCPSAGFLLHCVLGRSF